MSHASGPQRRLTQFGGVLNEAPLRGSRWFKATVVDYNPVTCTYTIAGPGGPMTGVVRAFRDVGESGILPRDTLVLVHTEVGEPIIDSVLKDATAAPGNANPTRVSEVPGLGAEDVVYSDRPATRSARGPMDPPDVLGGDWVRASPDGNLVGVLAGGTNVVRSSPMAQLRTHALGNLVEIISSNYRHITAMGDCTVLADGDKTSLTWRAAANQTDNGAQSEDWTLRLDVGATGDLFNFEVTTPAGQTLSRIHLSADGRMEFFATAGMDITCGDKGVCREDLAGHKVQTVRGDSVQQVGGSAQRTVDGNDEQLVSGSITCAVGQNRRTTVSGDDLAYAAGRKVTKVRGGEAPGGVACRYEIINGGVETVVGNPFSGALPAGQGQTWVNYAGGFNFVLQPGTLEGPKGRFNIISTKPDGVQLAVDGGASLNLETGAHDVTAGAAFYHAMLYEHFEALFQRLLNWLDGHTHIAAEGATTPPERPSSASLSSDVVKTRSSRVVLGG